MNALVKIGFKGLSVPAKVQKAGIIIKAMTGNPNFPTPKPSIAELTAATDGLENAFQAADAGDRNLKAAMLKREEDLDFKISLLAAYIQNESEGDEEKIRSAGFEVRSAATPPTELEHVSNLRATMSERNGEVSLAWKPLAGARTYVIEKSADGNNGWVICGHSTRAHGIVTGLPSLVHAYFRVAGIGSTGQSPWSDVTKSLVA
ncbi:MAG: fibronectin type III domain-containing protein [Chitinophagaceae bacterium]